MIQSLNQKSIEKMKKRKKTQKCHEIKPPQLEQPGIISSSVLICYALYYVSVCNIQIAF